MLKSLNSPIEKCVVESSRRTEIHDSDDDMLEREVLLCHGECVMLTCNLWVQSGFVSGALGYIENIFFVLGSKPPQLPQFVTVMFEKYCGVPFYKDFPILIPILPILRGNMRQMALKMAWVLTIQKS